MAGADGVVMRSVWPRHAVAQLAGLHRLPDEPLSVHAHGSIGAIRSVVRFDTHDPDGLIRVGYATIRDRYA